MSFINGQTLDTLSQEELTTAINRFKTFQKNEPYSKIAFTIIVSVRCQKLYLMNGSETLKEFVISTAKNGFGCEENSLKTPVGLHRVAEKFGEFGPIAGLYKERKFTGELATIITDKIDVPTDYVTSRILWLDGLEEKNKNSKARYIYIHGTPEEGLLGTPASHGCVRMSNTDVIELFDYLPENTLIDIVAE
jgi:lipoprotein-anchoring transpeptidase ErfK/SrfK